MLSGRIDDVVYQTCMNERSIRVVFEWFQCMGTDPLQGYHAAVCHYLPQIRGNMRALASMFPLLKSSNKSWPILTPTNVTLVGVTPSWSRSIKIYRCLNVMTAREVAPHTRNASAAGPNLKTMNKRTQVARGSNKRTVLRSTAK